MRDGPPAWGLGKGLTIPHHKTACYEMLHVTLELVVGSGEDSNETSGFIKGKEFFD
jgi:hypothetical protein